MHRANVGRTGAAKTLFYFIFFPGGGERWRERETIGREMGCPIGADSAADKLYRNAIRGTIQMMN